MLVKFWTDSTDYYKIGKNGFITLYFLSMSVLLLIVAVAVCQICAVLNTQALLLTQRVSMMNKNASGQLWTDVLTQNIQLWELMQHTSFRSDSPHTDWAQATAAGRSQARMRRLIHGVHTIWLIQWTYMVAMTIRWRSTWVTGGNEGRSGTRGEMDNE